MLDTIDRCFTERPEITFIEPYPANLRRILRRQDEGTVAIIEKKVQDIPVESFSRLRRGDLLFIDSSHVLKCGSDLHFLIFEVLPGHTAGCLRAFS